MACPGGCVGGAGQPLGAIKDMKDIRKSRSDSLYKSDSKENIKEAYMSSKFKMHIYHI